MGEVGRRLWWVASCGVLAVACSPPAVLPPQGTPEAGVPFDNAKPCVEVLPVALCEGIRASVAAPVECADVPAGPKAVYDLGDSRWLVLTPGAASVWGRGEGGCAASRPLFPNDPIAGATERFAMEIQYGYVWADGATNGGQRELTSEPAELWPSEGLERARLAIEGFEILPAAGGEAIQRWEFSEERACNLRRARLLDLGGATVVHLLEDGGNECVGADGAVQDTVERVWVRQPGEEAFTLVLEEQRSWTEAGKVEYSSSSRYTHRLQRWPVAGAVVRLDHETATGESVTVDFDKTGGDYDLQTAADCIFERQASDGGTWTVEVDGRTITLATFPTSEPVQSAGPCPR